MSTTISFAKALEAVQKDQPGSGDVHIDGSGTPPSKRKARLYREIVKAAIPGVPHPHIGVSRGRKAGQRASRVITTKPGLADPNTSHSAKPRDRGWARKSANGDDAPDFSIHVPITKFDADKRQVFGWASVIEKDGQPVIDSQGDIIPVDELEPAAYDFVVSSREGDDMHVGAAKSHLIESMVFTSEKQAALGIDIGKVAWWTGWQIDDDALWDAHKRGERPELSIGGSAIREEV